MSWISMLKLFCKVRSLVIHCAPGKKGGMWWKEGARGVCRGRRLHLAVKGGGGEGCWGPLTLKRKGACDQRLLREQQVCVEGRGESWVPGTQVESCLLVWMYSSAVINAHPWSS